MLAHLHSAPGSPQAVRTGIPLDGQTSVIALKADRKTVMRNLCYILSSWLKDGLLWALREKLASLLQQQTTQVPTATHWSGVTKVFEKWCGCA